MTRSRFIWHYLLLNKWSYAFAIVCIFCVNWLQVEIPRYIQQAIDLLGQSDSDSMSHLNTFVGAVVLMSLLMVVVRILSRMYSLNPGRITEATLKNDLFHRLNRLPDSFHRKFGTGKLISIINNDLNGIRLFYGIGFLQLVNVIFALSLTPVWMLRISPELTMYSVIPVIIAFVIFQQGFIRMRKYHKQRMLQLQSVSEQLMNYLSGIDLIKNQQMNTWVSQEVERVNDELLQTIMKATRIQTFIIPVLHYSNDLMKVIILGLGGYFLLQQDLSIGEVTAFLSYSVLLALPLMQLGRIAVVIQMGLVSIDSVQTILNEPIPKLDRNTNSLNQLKTKQTLTVQNLHYSYPDQDQAILKDINFTIEPGEKVGILGSIGSGKSTLVNCINHHQDINSGQIFWGDEDIAKISRTEWRQHVRTITQEPFLFSDTIDENIRFGSSAEIGSNERIQDVLELSQLSDDVSRFQNKRDTVVGEKGIMLSGGQKQRLSIARALLSPSDLLIMDNVLSAVDYETERKILATLFNSIQDQSVLVVSHRISALVAMDKILVMQEGEIIAQGPHEVLLKTCDYYRETWQLQQQEIGDVA